MGGMTSAPASVAPPPAICCASCMVPESMGMTILDTIVESKQKEVEKTKRSRSQAEVTQAAVEAEQPRGFASAVMGRTTGEVRLIAEIKKASPSAGVLVPAFDPAEIARCYERAGASAISVLTDEPFFRGHLKHIAEVKAACGLPVLRKDFILEAYQVYESRAAGADAILLIADILDVGLIESLCNLSGQLSMATIVEVHSRGHFDAVLGRLGLPAPEKYLLGINNRDLSIQQTDLAVCERLGALLPPGATFVAESGIKNRDDMECLGRAGAGAVLIGESILRETDRVEKIHELLGLS